uniref:MARVEL domain-containing protein n=1 Tax=Ornithorhynchus anatinus TaxID=9258 RepID=A0A6I8NYN5_ORNAN
MEGTSFGAGRAGAGVDPLHFLQEPRTILRIAAWVFSIVVFGAVVNEGYVNRDSGPDLHCVFNENEAACNYAIAIGLLAFFACIFFLVLDLNFQHISSVKDRKRAVLLDLAFSGLWSFLWFVGFCFLANQWQRTQGSKGVSQAGEHARAAVTFSFFSILVLGECGRGVGRGSPRVSGGGPLDGRGHRGSRGLGCGAGLGPAPSTNPSGPCVRPHGDPERTARPPPASVPAGGADGEGGAEVPVGHGHDPVRHRPVPGRPVRGRVPGGRQRPRRHRHLPRAPVRRDPGPQPQGLPGSRLLRGQEGVLLSPPRPPTPDPDPGPSPVAGRRVSCPAISGLASVQARGRRPFRTPAGRRWAGRGSRPEGSQVTGRGWPAAPSPPPGLPWPPGPQLPSPRMKGRGPHTAPLEARGASPRVLGWGRGPSPTLFQPRGPRATPAPTPKVSAGASLPSSVHQTIVFIERFLCARH